MKTITIPERELWDEKKEEFVRFPKKTIQIEHSLVSIRKWESKWHKPFLNRKEKKTSEETISYIQCMTVSPNNIELDFYRYLPDNVLEEIQKYIDNPMTATWFNEAGKPEIPFKEEVITAEIIYYWMIALNIPVEFEKWHIHQLLTLIKVVNIKTSPKKKMGMKEDLKQRDALNKLRRAKYGSKG